MSTATRRYLATTTFAERKATAEALALAAGLERLRRRNAAAKRAAAKV